LFFPRFKITVEVIFLNAVEYRLRLHFYVWHCFKTSSLQVRFQFGKQMKSQWAKSSKYAGWGTITKLLLVINSVVFCDVWAGALSWWRNNVAHVHIFCYDLPTNYITNPNGVWELMVSSATVFVDEFSNFFNTSCPGDWSPSTFTFNWHSTGLET
jgi:hypothetical protein